MGTVYLRAIGTKLRLSNDNLVISNESGKHEIPLSLVDGIVFKHP